jgi:hypothetical protein
VNATSTTSLLASLVQATDHPFGDPPIRAQPMLRTANVWSGMCGVADRHRTDMRFDAKGPPMAQSIIDGEHTRFVEIFYPPRPESRANGCRFAERLIA